MDFYLFLGTVAATIFTILGTIFYMVYGKLRVQENKIIASSSSSLSPSSSLSQNWKYHVFPSFHGPDVRTAFLSHILKEFRSKGIDPFIDNEIERSKTIGPELIEAIRGSRIAIVLLSKNYASSTWCMNELVEIMSCREVFGQTVMTIFYQVDPTDVKKQTGDFGKNFKKTCKGKTKEDIGRWRQALAEVATIAGYHSSDRDDEVAMIEKIATDISNMLNIATPSSGFDGLIGMEAHMEKMKLLLRLDVDEVRMIGIWGPPGIGKSTISRFLFNQVSNSFQLSTIMVNIKGSYPRPCLDEGSAQLQLQNQMLSQMMNHKDMVITHLGVARERLKDKKVFLVLDDVDRLAQLDALAKEAQWFGPGSRIIFTTEDLRVLEAHGINHIYKVEFPLTDEALQIFCMNAFGQKSPKAGFKELAHQVTYLAGKLPLGLKVMGSYFRRMSKQKWTEALPTLRSHLHGDIESVLMFSYNALCDKNKDLFLHIACFFNHKEVEYVVEHLAKSFLDVRQGLDVLAEKSLISIDDIYDVKFLGSYIRMHNLLAQLGRDIVRKQSARDPGQRQFLVDATDVCEVLTDYTAGSRSVIGIDFIFDETNDVNISERALEGMSSLQFLRLKNVQSRLKNVQLRLKNVHISLYLSHGLNYIPPKLQLLHWDYFPMTSLHFIVNTEFLVELIMYGSKLEKLWKGIKSLRNLKWMDLSYSENLKELPNLSTATSLKNLNLSSCSSLVELPFSIGNATNLQNLKLFGCRSLVELPSSIGNATNLQELDLRYCSSLVELPSSIGNATNLQDLTLSGCSNLVKLPSSIGNATSLQKLYLDRCSSLVELPSSIGNATNLQVLYLSRCSSLVELPSSIGNATNLRDLTMRDCSSLVKLPSSIGNATNLQKLYLNRCSSLVELPSSIGNATNLQDLDLRYCSSLVELPSSIGNATNNQTLYLSGCSSLVKLPSSIVNNNLQELVLSGCSRFVELPSSIGNATNLQKLDLSGCSSLVELPSSIGNATNLQKLDLSGCSSLVELPFSIGSATNLQELVLSGCSSLVELPASIGNLHKLESLILKGCSKLEVLPVNVNLKSLGKLDLSGCSSLKSFPEISTNISYLDLSGTAIEEVPLIRWSRLETLDMSYCENLKEFRHAIDTITEHHLSDTEIQEVAPLVHGFSRIRRLIIMGCKELLSLPKLPDSLSELDEENCESLERLDCGNCFKLNKEVRDIIIQTWTREVTVLPGGEIPTYFTHRANGGSLIVKLNERPFASSLVSKACILLVSKNDVAAGDADNVFVYFRIMDKQSSLKVPSWSSYYNLPRPLTEHLYIFGFEAELSSNELLFEFRIGRDEWVIKECGFIETVNPKKK